VSLRLAYAVVPVALVEPLANLRTQLDGFTPPLAQQTMSLFMEEGHFASHLRRMRTAYGARRAALLEELAPLAARGWTWSKNAAGLHVMLCHRDGASVRALAARSPLALALLSAYRERRGRDDGLFLRFGGLDLVAIRDGARALVGAALQAGPRA
jgi:GntR family transcriptional regulator/MocR family aminotransferase